MTTRKRMLYTRYGPRPKPFDTTFWSRVEIREPRVAYRLAMKYPIEPEVVMHVCDEPLCCNPLHLEGGTQPDNVEDARRKGRVRSGERCWQAKLTDEDVMAIRSSRAPSAELAKQYGVAEATISRVRRSLAWRHVSSHKLGVKSPKEKK